MATFHNISDRELTDLLKTDNEDAFTEIYNRYWKPLFHTAYNIIRDEEISQDTVQNIFINLWQRRHTSEIHFLKPYLQQATRFSILKVIRDQQTDAKFYERLKSITSEIIADDPLLFKEQQELLRELLNSMPTNFSETFRLSREEGLTYAQIASQLNISEKTVEKRMSKSLKYLRKGLNWELCIAVSLASLMS
jgi:RNA polymerase sigma-70 factor (family 1)